MLTIAREKGGENAGLKSCRERGNGGRLRYGEEEKKKAEKAGGWGPTGKERERRAREAGKRGSSGSERKREEVARASVVGGLARKQAERGRKERKKTKEGWARKRKN